MGIPFFIGIGGSGMSSLAHIYLDRGEKVYGYDKAHSAIISDLKERGAIIYRSSEEIPYNIMQSIEFAVYSSAVRNESHPVFSLFQTRGISLFHRSEILFKLFKDQKNIVVAGSHGKTSTTTMIAEVLFNSLQHPGFMIGGEPAFSKGRGGASGNGRINVYEADESDGSFLNYRPNFSVITNIDNDHLDYYGTEKNLKEYFAKFIEFSNHSVVCLDDPGIQECLKLVQNKNKIIGYQTENSETVSDLKKEQIQIYSIKNNYIIFKHESKEYSLSTPFPGDHYLTNALAAILSLKAAEIPIEESIKWLHNYRGVKRRLEFLGEIHGTRVYDDYGHHPTEIRAVIESMKKIKGNGRILIIFQPHRYTRTRDHYLEFARSLSQADKLFLLPVYPAGEVAISGINSEIIYKNLENRKDTVLLSGDIQKDILLLLDSISSEDCLISLGAGNVRDWANGVLNYGK